VGHPQQPVAEAPAAAPEFKERKWLPTLAVFLILAVVSLGGLFAVGAAEEALTETAPGPGASPRPPVQVTDGVTITPLEGWEEAGRFEGIRLTRGTATLDGVGLPFEGSPEELFDAYVEEILRSEASQLEAADQLETVHLDAGFTAVRGFYFGVFGERNASIEGELTTVLVPGGIGVVFDGWAETGSYQFVRDEVNHMIQGLQVG
jgi:hypothetical protein